MVKTQMEIIEKSYRWSGYLEKRKETKAIVLHHAAAKTCSPEDIHRIHLMNGWAGIGYHFYVAKDGSVFRGRPLWSKGAHVSGNNSSTVGICFEGNFEKEDMQPKQQAAGGKIVGYLKSIYPQAQVKMHKDYNKTACPGKNFPFKNIASADVPITETSEIVDSLFKRGIMTNVELWMEKCVYDSNAYYLAQKICNKTKNVSQRKTPLESVNDIVWELSERKIITDKELWLRLFKEDTDLYWLGFKAANRTANKEG